VVVVNAVLAQIRQISEDAAIQESVFT